MSISRCCILFICFLVLAFAQAPDTLWTRTYGTSGMEIGTAIDQTSDNGYIIGGSQDLMMTDTMDAWIIRTDNQGDTLWTKVYGDSVLYEVCQYIEQTSDNGYIALVSTAVLDTNWVYYFKDIILMKFDPFGDTVWTRTYGGDSAEFGRSAQQTTDGGYIIAGYTESYGSGSSDIWLIKTSSNGDTLWTKTYGGSGCDRAGAVQQTTDQGYIIAGSRDAYGPDSSEIYLIKTDTQGETLWTKTYGGVSWDDAYCVQQTSDGGYIIGADTYSFGAGSWDSDIWLIKTDSTGDTLWTKIFSPGTQADHCRSLIQTHDFGYLLVGQTFSLGALEGDVWIIKTDSLGDTLWTRLYGGAEQDGASCVQQCSDSTYIIAGYTRSFGAGAFDAWFLKMECEPGISEHMIRHYKKGYDIPTLFSGNLYLPKDKQCRVFDITGRVVMPGKIKPGVYFIEIDGKITQKVVKIK